MAVSRLLAGKNAAAQTTHLLRPLSGHGTKRADLHLHSSYSCDVPDLPQLSPRALYNKAIAEGMDFFTLTDHDTLKGISALQRELTAEYGAQPPIPVIPGIEMKIRDPEVGHTVHVNVLGLDVAQMRRLASRRRSMSHFLAYCREQGLYHAYNHPFWFEPGERGNLITILRLMRAFPVVEMNAGRISQLNDRTAELARRLGINLVANSDSHTGQVGKAHTVASGDTAAEFLANVLQGASCITPHNMAFRAFIGEVMHVIDLASINHAGLQFKRAMLKEAPVSRSIARTLLGSRRLMRRGFCPQLIRLVMGLLACWQAYAYILRQKQMSQELAEAEAQFWQLLDGGALTAEAEEAGWSG